ncbi:nicotinamidase-related amidase [Evansella vedderi]|uniref:Nicotinamidase-related amidase n=1 Tax=Evansella vedderi TaxID=38282 RepID=A0ABT9ZYH3_9BACI|nr:isochorismatase family protein [Evansella vedderi]MDQ0256292.1 nicotinamidase-related amidase [Evansella vedderi]
MSGYFDGFGHQIGIGTNPAIIVVDYIKGFTDPDSPLGSEYSSELLATKKLLREARSNRIPVLFTTVSYDAPELDGGYFVKKVPALEVLRSTSSYTEVDSRLEWDERKEVLVVKKFASAFFGTNLHSLLTSMKIDTLIVVGCTTSGCVRATVVDGLQYGYRVTVPMECVGDRSSKAHEANLYDMNQKYADVRSLDTVLSELNRM